MLTALQERVIGWMTAVAVILYILRFLLPDLIIDVIFVLMIPVTAKIANPKLGVFGRSQ